MKYSIFIILILCFSCGPEIGGGGSVHNPPDFIKVGEFTVFQLELSVWGEGSDKISKRYTQVQCHFKEKSDKEFITINMDLKNQNQKADLFECTIPAFHKSGMLEYYFTMIFDGIENRRDEKPIEIKG